MSVDVVLHNRKFQRVPNPEIDLRPHSLRWHAVGGPDLAVIDGFASVPALWQAFEWLRYGVTVHMDNEPAWWGYVHEINISTGEGGIGLSLDSMDNSVAVVYSYVEPGAQEVGRRQTTAWASNEESVIEFGLKQRLLSIDGATPVQAESTRDTWLQQHAWPVAFPGLEGSKKIGIELLCRGWWQTLGWRHYTNSNTNDVALTAQINNIISTIGSDFGFLLGTDIVDAITATSSEYQDGDRTALEIVEEMLFTGNPPLFPHVAWQRMLATVTQDRRVRIFQEPASGRTNLRYHLDGRVTDVWGNAVRQAPVGQWCDVELPHAAMPAYAPGSFFIARAEYLARSGRWRVEPWGAPSPWDLTKLVQG